MPDLATSIAGIPRGNASMRIGTLTGYDAATGNVTVNVGGGALIACPYMDSYVPTIGEAVVMLSAGPAWVVLGSASTGTPPLTQEYAEVLAQESTSSGSYTDLTTVGPSVTIQVPATGRVLVHYGCQIGWIDNNADGNMGGAVAVATSGANVSGPDANREARAYTQLGGTTYNVGIFQVSNYKPFSGLAQGLTTFTLQYVSLAAGKTCDFSKRSILVLPY